MMCVPKPNAPHHLGCVMQSPARCQRRLSHPATPEVSAVFASRRLMVSGRPVVVPGGLTLELGIQRRRTTPWPPPPARSDPPCRPRPQVCPATPGAGPSRPQQGTHPGRHTTPTTRHPTVLTQPQYAAPELEDLGPAGTNPQHSSPMFCTALMSVEPTLLAVCAPCVSQTRSHHSALLTAAMVCHLARRASLPVQPSNRPDRETRRLSALAAAALFSTRVLCGIAY
jgi:hypothetical protein